MLWLRGAKTRVINFELVQPILPRYIHVTDRQTNRRTDGQTTCDSNTALALRASCGKTFTAHASCRVTGGQWVRNNHILGTPNANLPVQYNTCMGLYGAAMKNNGCLLLRPLMSKAKSPEHFLSPAPKVPNFGGFGA